MDIETVATTLAGQMEEAIEYYRTLKTHWNHPFLNLQGIENEALTREAALATLSLQRTAIMFFGGKACLRDEGTRRGIAEALGKRVVKLLAAAPEFHDFTKDNDDQFFDLLDARGRKYFQLVQSHKEEIGSSDMKPLMQELQWTFEQYCRGGGGENDPIVIGTLPSMTVLNLLAAECWTKGFAETFSLLKKHDLY